MKMLCLIGLHWWEGNKDWATGTCRGCQDIEVYLYDKNRGAAFWERVS